MATVRVCVCGDEGTGKSSLIVRIIVSCILCTTAYYPPDILGEGRVRHNQDSVGPSSNQSAPNDRYARQCYDYHRRYFGSPTRTQQSAQRGQKMQRHPSGLLRPLQLRACCLVLDATLSFLGCKRPCCAVRKQVGPFQQCHHIISGRG